MMGGLQHTYNMAEFLIRVVDKINSDPYLDAKCMKRGDVISICQDGWAWSSIEKKDPQYRILQAPNITETQALGFLAPELPVDILNPSKVLQRRAFKLDISLLPVSLLTWLNDDKRTQPTKLFSGTLAEVLALKVTKPILVDPNIITP